MSIILCAEGSMPLGLDPLEVLLHLLNLAILVVAVRFLLYKPIKKFMDARKEAYKKEAEEGKKQMEEGLKLKEEGLQLIEKAQDDAVRLSEEATASALLQAEEIRLEAEKEAKLILENARKDAEAYQREQKEELGREVGELAMQMASKILEREVTFADNDAVIDSLISEWSKKD